MLLAVLVNRIAMMLNRDSPTDCRCLRLCTAADVVERHLECGLVVEPTTVAFGPLGLDSETGKDFYYFFVFPLHL